MTDARLYIEDTVKILRRNEPINQSIFLSLSLKLESIAETDRYH
jgi:hypothetical protein